tara:strand:- start:196 stop:465 length:270 start_codon:yes stop_codon:yes gene_type:complete
MKHYVDPCPYCTGKDMEEGKLAGGWTEDDIEGHYKPATPQMDNHNIFVFYSCEDCDKEQRSKYDPIIFNDYEAYERKVADYGERFDEEY